jgi:phosphoribosylglycinamide formyltransferase-1
MIKYAVAASGGGTDFQSAVDAQKAGKIPYGEIVALFSNKVNAGALDRAKKAGIPAHFIDHTVPQEKRDAAILEVLNETGAEFLFLAGYLKRISPAIIERIPVFNIHPALDMVRFGGKGMDGLNVHEAVLAAGETVSGATIHQVDEQYDHGKVLMQTPNVPIFPDDTAETLQQRVLVEEHNLIPQFLDKLTRKLEQQKQTGIAPKELD